MRIFITGGTGLIGKALIKVLVKRGCQITVLTRDVRKAVRILGNQIEYCQALDSLVNFDGYDAVINLAGESIAGKRWTIKQKERLCESRWGITWQLSNLIRESKTPPQVFISGSAVGYYGSYNDIVVTEKRKPHEEFTSLLCEKWEKLSLEAENGKTRICLLRTAIVLSPDGGMLSKMVKPFYYYLGSVLGDGNQYISWIHINDMIDAILFLLNNPDANGAFNMASPYPVTNRVFSETLAKVLNRPCFFRIPAFILSFVLGESSTLLTNGQRAIPEKLLKIGFKFQFEKISDALESIYRKE